MTWPILAYKKQRSNVKIIRIKYFSIQENDGIFNILDQIMVVMFAGGSLEITLTVPLRESQ